MKKILIVNNNMKVGGVQKSLYNLLWALDADRRYDITLLLFSKSGTYAEDLPPSVKVVECNGSFRFLGREQREFRGFSALARGFFAAISRVCGRRFAVRLMLLFQPTYRERFDYAVSFLHNGRSKAFYGGVQDYVLHRVRAKKKVTFLHGDYGACGADHAANNRMMERFDMVAACSDGCRDSFLRALPHMARRCVTVRNCHRYDKIREMAQDAPIRYDEACVNVLTVARLTHEKGIERAIEAVGCVREQGVPLILHLVGDGAMRAELEAQATRRCISDYVHFYGEQQNPYRYMKCADLLLLPSYHEAAPMVIDEARALGLPVLTTATTSVREMVEETACGVVCENNRDAIVTALYRLAADRTALLELKERVADAKVDNRKALAQWSALFKDSFGVGE